MLVSPPPSSAVTIKSDLLKLAYRRWMAVPATLNPSAPPEPPDPPDPPDTSRRFTESSLLLCYHHHCFVIRCITATSPSSSSTASNHAPLTARSLPSPRPDDACFGQSVCSGTRPSQALLLLFASLPGYSPQLLSGFIDKETPIKPSPLPREPRRPTP
ncbi:unnamed protein product [Arabis nemorensis]|uniref:Uncharacterized protein n=1 Tax=Arabis nemorensis TaxID=586526 RepID=A0A565B0V5_9BRAS|nr:unnamed protein product [Arabis nemorensis]